MGPRLLLQNQPGYSKSFDDGHVGMFVSLIAHDDAGADAEQVVGIIPLFALRLVGVPACRHGAQFLHANDSCDNVKERRGFGVRRRMIWNSLVDFGAEGAGPSMSFYAA